MRSMADGQGYNGFVALGWRGMCLAAGSRTLVMTAPEPRYDVLHVADLCRLIDMQIDDLECCVGKTYNVGGGFG